LNAIGSVQRFGEFEVDRGAYELRRRGRPVRLEGRAMSLLLLLLERPDELVTRAEIVARLWGSDSFVDVESGINTAVRKLRAALRDDAANPQVIRTVQGKGYRFVATLETLPASRQPPPAPANDAPPAGAPAETRGKGRLIRWAAAALLVAVVGLLALALSPRTPTPRAQVLPLKAYGGAPGPQAFADMLSDKLAGALQETGVQTGPPPRWTLPSLRPPPPDLVLGGGVAQSGESTTVRLFLEDARANVTLWSHEFVGPTAEPDRLAAQVVAYADDTILTALEPQLQRGLAVDAPTLALYIHGAELFKNGPGLNPGGIRRAFEQVVAREPDFNLAHGELALALVFEAFYAGPQQRRALTAQARREAEAAIHRDPASAGAAYGALGILAEMHDPTDLQAVERPTLRALAAAPEFAFGWMRECQLLTTLGRFEEALPHCLRAVAMRPTAMPVASTFADLLIARGHYEAAAKQVVKVAEINPGDLDLWRQRFYVAAFSGALPQASDILRHPPELLQPGRKRSAALELYLKARASRSAVDGAAASRALLAALAAHEISPGFAVLAISTMGQVDAALDLLMKLPPAAYAGEHADFLTYAAAEPLRADDRYWTAAARAGLVRYWTSANAWPDFCSEPPALRDCRARAQAALRRLGAPAAVPTGTGS
jgi:DNA-binding winged helix-turn-helix (wHTH) protein/tetratricopeptide (TPR) repeat protein